MPPPTRARRALAFRLGLCVGAALVLALAPPAPAALASSPLPCAPGYEHSLLTHCTADADGRSLLELVEFGPPRARPPVQVEPLPAYNRLLRYHYAQVVEPNAPVYGHPADALEGRPPLRSLGSGFVFVSQEGIADYRDQSFVQINPGEYVRSDDLSPVHPSRFHGTSIAEPPSEAFGWVIEGIQVRKAPGAEAEADDAWLPRYASIRIYAAQPAGEWVWYQVGPNQWIEQRAVALIATTPPANVAGAWIAVDIFEQTLVAYQDSRPVFATLISSGIAADSTPPGVYHIYAKLNYGRMSGAYRRDRSDYYYLEDVPDIMYFDGDRGLHGAYWHDGFGFKRSHGCVNLAPADARWLFQWAPAGTPVLIFSSASSATT